MANVAVANTIETAADTYVSFAAAASDPSCPVTSAFVMPLEDVVAHKNFDKYNQIQQKIIQGCLQHYKNYDPADIYKIIKAIGTTTTFKAHKFADKQGKYLGFSAYTPEDKTFSIHVLLALLGKLKAKNTNQDEGERGTKYKRPDAYVRGYNTTMGKFCKKEYDSKELVLIMRHLGQLGIDLSHIIDGVKDNTPTDPKED
jgi:hypothetical protein